MTYPDIRPRRLRRTPALRRLVAESGVAPRQLVLPLFVRENAVAVMGRTSEYASLAGAADAFPARVRNIHARLLQDFENALVWGDSELLSGACEPHQKTVATDNAPDRLFRDEPFKS